MGVWDAIVAGFRFAGKVVGLIQEKKQDKKNTMDAVRGEAAGRSAYDAAENAGHESVTRRVQSEAEEEPAITQREPKR
jgi:hypothetical protein